MRTKRNINKEIDYIRFHEVYLLYKEGKLQRKEAAKIFSLDPCTYQNRCRSLFEKKGKTK